MIFIIKRTKVFTSFLKEFEKWCYKNGYLMENLDNGKKQVHNIIKNFIKNSDEMKPDVISRYLLKNYFRQFVKQINNDGVLVRKYVTKNIEIPKYIFDFEVFMTELTILYS